MDKVKLANELKKLAEELVASDMVSMEFTCEVRLKFDADKFGSYEVQQQFLEKFPDKIAPGIKLNDLRIIKGAYDEKDVPIK